MKIFPHFRFGFGLAQDAGSLERAYRRTVGSLTLRASLTVACGNERRNKKSIHERDRVARRVSSLQTLAVVRALLLKVLAISFNSPESLKAVFL